MSSALCLGCAAALLKITPLGSSEHSQGAGGEIKKVDEVDLPIWGTLTVRASGQAGLLGV